MSGIEVCRQATMFFLSMTLLSVVVFATGIKWKNFWEIIKNGIVLNDSNMHKVLKFSHIERMGVCYTIFSTTGAMTVVFYVLYLVIK